MRLRLAPVLVCALASLVGCASAGGPGPAGSPGLGGGGSSPAASDTAATIGTGSTGTSTGTEPPPASGEQYRVSYDWGVPSNDVSVPHPLVAPIADPPGLPLPHLVGIYVGNHPEGSPAYQRISFYFRGAFPSYHFRYVSQVLTEAQGSPIPLQGNAFLRVGFTDAQAHDNVGASTVKASPPASIGFANLRSYGFAGDFEGHVTYGLGIQVAANSDQVLKIRAGELTKSDGNYVVHFDVQNG